MEHGNLLGQIMKVASFFVHMVNDIGTFYKNTREFPSKEGPGLTF